MTTSAKSGPPRDRTPAPAPPPPPAWRRYLIPAGVSLTLLFFLFGGALFSSSPGKHLDYSMVLADVQQGQVKDLTIASNGNISGTLKDGSAFTSAVSNVVNDGGLVDKAAAAKVGVKFERAQSPIVGALVGFLPLLLFVAFFVYVGRRAQKMSGGPGGIMGIGKSRAKIYDEDRPKTRFSDVAGYEGVKQEVSEVVDFLKHPERYRKAGAIGPKGVLMVGPPGSGKTLMARAVAGEAEVPFFAVTGSSFVEMFVGVGASRVRDLFSEARKRGPAIIFIDEIDAIGGRRGQGAFGSNDEREQTLNQMLAEMDGFDASHEVVVIAATNRPETLDPALTRPGRFDRQVTVPLPTRRERAAILAVHALDKMLGPDVDLDVTARGTPGFSGADLANLINEAAINAVRSGRDVIRAVDIADARERVILGRREGSNVLLPDEKRAVAVHESGHALVAAMSEHGDPVERVTILPAGMALGSTEQLPQEERHLHGEGYMRDILAIRMGGRAAELVVLGEGSTGAANDIAGATQLATRMIREFGLSAAFGPVGYSGDGPKFLGETELSSRPYSEATQELVDLEVRRLLREAEDRAITMLTERRDALDRLTTDLLEHETVDGDAVRAALDGARPTLEKPAPAMEPERVLSGRS